MQVVEAIDKLGDITLASDEAIEDARFAYKELAAAYRPIVGNYDTLNAAISRLYEIRKDYIISDTLPTGNPNGSGNNNGNAGNNGSGTADGNDASIPETGETTNVGMWIMLLMSVSALAAVGVRSKKARKER